MHGVTMKKETVFVSCEQAKEFQLSPLAKSKNPTILTTSEESR